MRKAMIFAVDRIEGEWAVLEDENGRMADVPLADLPSGTRQGSVLRLDGGVYTLDPEEESRRRKANFDLQESLFNRPGS